MYDDNENLRGDGNGEDGTHKDDLSVYDPNDSDSSREIPDITTTDGSGAYGNDADTDNVYGRDINNAYSNDANMYGHDTTLHDSYDSIHQNADPYSENGNTTQSSQQNAYYNKGHEILEGKKVKKEKTEKQPKVKKKRNKWATGIAMAVVVGLVAGVVFYGVNYFGNKVIYDTTTSKTAALDSSDSSDSTTTSDSSSENTTAASTSTAASGTVASVAEKCMPSLVTIATITVQEMQSIFGGSQSYESEGAGSGVIVGKNDTELLIATNNHVIENATSLSVGFVDQTSVDAVVKGSDSDNDLAVVAVKLADISEDTLSKISAATMGDSDELTLGEQVVAIGNALGYGQSVTSGYVSALDRSIQLNDGTTTFESTGLIQTDASINGGNSGGALLNMNGELIGINEAKASSASSGTSVEGMGYAIPISKAKPILENLMSLTTREKVSEDEMGYLGVTCADVTSEAVERYGMPEGVCVTEVLEDSPAEQAGVQKGDVIVSLDGRSVSSYSELQTELKYYAAGETIDMVVKRADDGTYTEKTLSITLGDKSVIEDYNSSDSDSDNDNSSDTDNSRNSDDGNSGNSGSFWGLLP